MEEQFTNVVEGALGRKVIAYMSQVHSDPDISAELFVLEPAEAPMLVEHDMTLAPAPSDES